MKHLLLFLFVVLLAGCNHNTSKKSCSDLDQKIKKEREIAISRLDTTKFVVLEESFENHVFNYYLLYKGAVCQDSICDFIQRFRDVHCAPTNINLLLAEDIYPSVKHYPIPDNEYIWIANSYIAFSSFDTPEVVSVYPLKDERYNKLKK